MENRLTHGVEASEGVISATATEQILCASPDSFRATLQRVSQQRDPERWAAEHLKLGAVLRLRAQRESGAKRIQTLRQTIEAFEAALGVYCRFSQQADEQVVEQSIPSRDEKCHGSERSIEPVDIILEVTRRPFVTDADDLDDALYMLREKCSRKARKAGFATWMVSMINLGCTLTLQGKCSDLQGGTFRLDEAVDTFRALLAEPKLMEFPYERAIVHINLAEALSSMGELAFPHQRTEYLESAVGALATALSLVAPRVWRALVLVHPASFV